MPLRIIGVKVWCWAAPSPAKCPGKPEESVRRPRLSCIPHPGHRDTKKLIHY